MSDLLNQSIAIILKNQSTTGAYVASPNFPTYQYCWLRDGAFIAHAMNLVGEHASARAFFHWVDRTLKKHAAKLDHLFSQLSKGISPDDSEFLHTRYSLEGEEVIAEKAWGNFQIDGYGTWLWALAEHVSMANDSSMLKDVASSVEVTVRYLMAVWLLPNYDCWEEHPEYIHPYSLGAVYGGLGSAIRLAEAGMPGLQLDEIKRTQSEIQRFVLNYGISGGRLVKHILPASDGRSPHPVETNGVDASLLGLCIPYSLFSIDDPVMSTTLHRIESDLLRPGGGVYRYRTDTYYGGGEWLLLTAWLGWVYTCSGRLQEAARLLHWIESQAGPDGSLPEQVSRRLLSPPFLAIWEKRWGPVAKPLLWSHAMHLILHKAIQHRS